MDIDGFKLKFTHPKVYEPAEDSYFLAKFLLKEFSHFNNDVLVQKTVIDVGIGSGYVSAIIGQKFPEIGTLIGTDISIYAITMAYQNLSLYLPNMNWNLILTNFIDGISLSMDSIIWFNPPYVRSEVSELESDDPIVRTYAGGLSGVEVIINFLKSLSKVPFTVIYLVSSSINDNDKIFAFEDLFSSIKIVKKKKIPGEELIIIRIIR